MTQKYFTVVTKVGLAKIANAAALGSKLQLSERSVTETDMMSNRRILR